LPLKIDAVGKAMVACDASCSGVANRPEEGILPRCLIVERGSAQGRGALVSGINPARSKEQERAFYRRSGPSYEAVVEHWHEKISPIAYYERLRAFLRDVGVSGPIVWTDLAKCENAPDQEGLLPLQTLRTCTGRHLTKELAALPEGWPLVAVGTEAYKALAYLEPGRTVLGIPHPTGSHGHFLRMFESGHLVAKVRQAAASALSSSTPVAVWLSAEWESSPGESHP
jgi:hypothetical protein